MRFRLVALIVTLCLVVGTVPAQAQSIPVSLPHLNNEAGTITIPVQVNTSLDGDEGGGGIIAYDLTIEYDDSLIDITGAYNAGTLTDGWNISPNTSDSNHVIIASNSSTGQGLEGEPGTLVILEAEVNDDATGTSPLTFIEFKFNSENVPSTATNGSVSTSDLPDNMNLIINEVHADPADEDDCGELGLPDDCGDANNDGTTNIDDDEFIEIINGGSSPIDISEYEILDADNEAPRYTFPEGTTIAPNTAAVVFGGGTPNGIPGLVSTTGTLALSNDGDTITLLDNEGNVVTAVTYSDGAIVDQSVTRNPDFEGPFTLHMEASPEDERYSPGRTLDGGDLPVELSLFDAVRDGQDVLLQWATASETDNSGFSVQQRVEGTFEEIGFVEGAGTTTSPRQYDHRVTDLSPGTYVFRLQQIDGDGTATPSREVEVTIPVESSFVLESAYPNPFQSEATFTLRVRETQEVTVTLFNTLGQRVQDLFIGTVRAGAPETFRIDGNDLPSGVYLYRVQGRTFSASKQVTRVK